MRKIIVFLILQGLFLPLSGFAHGDLDQRIQEVTDEIKVSPDSAYLYFKRGKLLFQHQEYLKSVKDLGQSNTLGHTSLEQNLLFSRNYFRLENYTSALTYLEAILAIEDKNVLALKLKAQVYLKQNNYKDAALAFEQVIAFSVETFPENYIEASFAWDAMDNEEAYKNAIAIIEKGIKNLGDLISLYDRLIELAISKKDYKHAIQMQLQVLNLMPRKEKAYFKLAELYELDANIEKASEYLILAKQHFFELPVRIQNTSFMKELLEAILTKEINLKSNKP